MIAVACDKFKGTLSAAEACGVICRALGELGYDAAAFPMADGGEGTAAVMRIYFPDLICIESCATPSGIPVSDRSSYHIGSRLVKALEKGRTCLAIGGTATADCGAGILQALGYKFVTDDREIAQPLTPRLLSMVTKIIAPEHTPFPDGLFALADVRASLCGSGLSAMDFLAQKGADAEDFRIVRQAFGVMEKAFGAGGVFAGAGGGIGYACQSVLKVPVFQGAEYIASRIIPGEDIEMIVSGEGSVDAQTAGGKVVDCLSRMAARADIPFAVFGGRVAPDCPYPNAYGCVAWDSAPAADAAAALGECVKENFRII